LAGGQIYFEPGNLFRILNPASLPGALRATIQSMKQLLILIAGAWLLAGCASRNVNPPAARADTGYVDLYTTGEDDLNWEVSRFDAHAKKYVVLFSEFKPLPQGVLRLALSPGKYPLCVTFLNCVVREPAVFDVEAVAGRVTPVHVVLTEDGITQVVSKEQNAQRNVRGGGGRMAAYNPDETSMYRLSAVINAPMPYRVREQMPYAH
jgi:hypothetical protein